MTLVAVFESDNSFIDGSSWGLRDMTYSDIWSTVNEKIII